ncbi:hypothetical protein CYY_006713 [Polysphondylium violaceum]|uniref:Cytochrome P450 family protein n=1 Tax=Polysphondylium violaceum TaxID=133409 RepID=A0A8J4PRU6_9MYCE|nr:hypothetical protein CYY_006713 [Polysphondylium violaceum]
MLRFVIGKRINYLNTTDQDKEMIDQLIKPIEDVFSHLGAGHLGDYLDFLKPLYSKYLNFNDPSLKFKQYFDDQVLKHIGSLDPSNPQDLLDHLLLEKDTLTNNSLKTVGALAIDFINAGTETSSSSIEWFFLAMINNQEIQNKAFQELKNLNKNNSMITLLDRPNTPYTNALIKEVSRRYSIAPLGLPRSTTSDITLCDTFIPKNTQILLNLHYLFTNEKYWENPMEFNPDRFLNNNNRSDTYVPFGMGPRNCIGQGYASDILYITIANVLLNFKIVSPNGEKVSDKEFFSLTVHPKSFLIKLLSR